MLRVGLDARGTEADFKLHHGRGTGRYATELIQGLSSLQHDKKLTGLSVVPFGSSELGRGKIEQTISSLLPFGRQTFETQVFLPQRLARLPVDMVHFMSHGDGTPRCPFPYVVTILDLIPLKFHWLYSKEKASWRLKLARWVESTVVRGATGYLTISEASKRDIVTLLGIAAEKVHVTPLGVDRQWFSDLELSTDEKNAFRRRVCAQLGLRENARILLYVGGIDPRKNLPFLLDVFARYLGAISSDDRATETFLVIAGRYENDDQLPKLLSQVQRLGIESQVKFTGFLPDDELRSLYRAANLFVFPSLYEGFGLPVLEAMATGLPVMAAENSSIPEVVGANYQLYRDNDVDGWVGGLVELLGSEDRLISMSRLGIDRAGQFNWERTAVQTAAAYTAIAQSAGIVGQKFSSNKVKGR